MNPALSIPKNDKKIVRAWVMYDWANSVYSLVITSAIFPVYYQAVTTDANGHDVVNFFGFAIANSVLYSYALSASFLIIAPLLPLLSGMADYSGTKKFFMKIFVYIGGLGCMGLFLFEGSHNIEWGILCSMLASIGYAGSVVFYDAFLPEIVTEDRMDSTSARGYSMGYYGGVVLLVINLVMIMNWTAFGFSSEGSATRFAFLMVGIWWIGFAQYTFVNLPEKRRTQSGRLLLFHGYHELRKVWQSLTHHPDLRKYLLAYFFFNMGVQTVMYLAATFGSKELKLEAGKLILTVLIIQFVGAIGAHLFASVSRRMGNKQALMIMIGIWIGICGLAYLITKEYEFYAVASLVGLVMGGIQSLSRATYAKLIPPGTIDNASYFSFFDVTFNLSIVMGTFSYGLIEQLTGSMRNSTIALAVFFVMGMILLAGVKAARLGRPDQSPV